MDPAGHFAKRLETVCVISVVLSMLSLVNSHVAMPSYNFALAAWGLFASYSRSSRAAFALMGFTSISMILDIVFLTLWSHGDANVLKPQSGSIAGSTTGFSVAMMSINLISKLAVLYFTMHLFAALGGSEAARRQ